MNQGQPNKSLSLAEIVQKLPSELNVTLQGDPSCVIHGVCTIQHSKPGYITFLVNPLYKKYLKTTQASAVVLTTSEAEECPTNAILTGNPYLTYAKIVKLFDPRSKARPGIHPSAVIGEECEIDPSASIGPQCVIADHVKIGAGVVLGPSCTIGEYSEIDENTHFDARVTLYDRVRVGKRVQIASGAVIGSDGFGIAKDKGVWQKVPQIGGVVIQDDVEIGANTAIDRGAIEDTVIEKGVKLDNLIQIGHNVRIGEHTAIAGCTGIAGSAVIGKNCIVGGNAGFAGHITVADNVVITGKTSVTKSIREPGVYSSGVGGLTSNLEWRKNSARLHRLDRLIQQVKALEATLKNKVTLRDT